MFVAIDRATRWVFIEIYADQSDSSSTDFLIKLNKACPIAIVKLLTDNGSQFIAALPARKKTRKPATGFPAASTRSTCYASNWRSNIA